MIITPNFFLVGFECKSGHFWVCVFCVGYFYMLWVFLRF